MKLQDLTASVSSRPIPNAEEVLSPEAIHFIEQLHSRFEESRVKLLAARAERARQLEQGTPLEFIPSTADIRSSSWTIAPVPQDLQDRRVEITGPAEAKMTINALNSGAKVFMADLEDSLSPTWKNIIGGQICLKKAVRRTLTHRSPEGKEYRLGETLATLIVRPRGWHLTEENFRINGQPVSASLFDFALYFFHNAKELFNEGSGPYFYLPKMESHLEARLWNDVFNFSEDYLRIPRGHTKCTVLIETLPAAFEMDEILFELKEHIVGLNAGRWDYLFSMIKKFSFDSHLIFPDRGQLTMTVPFMRAYTKLLVQTCHRRGAHAIGGMAAFIPSRKDAEINKVAFAKVTEDKEREANDGFDGTWVAHPDLVPVAQKVFDRVLGSFPHQKNKIPTGEVLSQQLLPAEVSGGKRTAAGMRNNIQVSLLYLNSWLQGLGAVGIYNLMEDAATAEISRAELWQWVQHRCTIEENLVLSPERFQMVLQEEVAKLNLPQPNRISEAALLLKNLVLNKEFTEFLTIPAYLILNNQEEKWN